MTMLTFFVDIRSDHIYIQIAMLPMEREADPETRPAPSLGLRARRWAAGLRWKESFWDLNLKWTKSHWWQNLIFPRKVYHVHPLIFKRAGRTCACSRWRGRSPGCTACCWSRSTWPSPSTSSCPRPCTRPRWRSPGRGQSRMIFYPQVSALMLYLYLVSCVFMLYLLLYLTTRWVSRVVSRVTCHVSRVQAHHLRPRAVPR